MVKKFIVLIFLCYPVSVLAGRGCCSSHGGECGCSATGRSVCCDGTYSKTCRCTPATIYGCTDRNANNYNANANVNDGSCRYDVYGCMDKNASNYNSKANKSDGSCTYIIYVCLDSYFHYL